MEPYAEYSKYYDFLLKDELDYEGDCNFVELSLAKLGCPRPFRILDIGCGTGEDSIRLTKRGHEVTGIDASAGMIDEATKKAKSEGLLTEFFVQDMRGLRLDRVFDCAICLRGGFARLMDNGDFGLFFGGLSHHLRSGGLFIFDFVNTDGVVSGHRNWKLKEKEGLLVVRLDRSDFQQQQNLLIEHHEFLVIENGKLIDHFTEIHKLRTHSLSKVKEILVAHGFVLIEPYGDEVEKYAKDLFAIRCVSRLIPYLSH